MSDLDELERLEQAATPGPWIKGFGGAVEGKGNGMLMMPVPSWNADRQRERKFNTQLTVAMRNNIKALIESARVSKWYANSENYINDTGYPAIDEILMERISEDQGQRARDALAKLGGEKC